MVTCPEVSAWCGLCLTLLCVFHGHVLLLCVCAFDRHLENAAMSFVPRAALKIPSKKKPQSQTQPLRNHCAYPETGHTGPERSCHVTGGKEAALADIM